MNGDCIFCKIAAGELPSYTLFEDGEFKIILDRYPWSRGHALVLLKRHAKNIFELTEPEASKLSAHVLRAAGAVNAALAPDGINILQNNGEAAGQSVGHFHTHIIPRYQNDEIDMLFPHSDPPREEFEAILNKIKKYQPFG